MNPFILALLLANNGPDHGIYGGFNLQWVEPVNGLGMVALSVGSAIIDGVVATNVVRVPAPSFPNDSTEITPWVPNLTAKKNFVAYCYIVNIGATSGNGWFLNTPGVSNFDFVCEASNGAGSNYAPTPDGHPTNGLTYPPGTAGTSFPHAIFVGSVVGTNVASAKLVPGTNGGGFSVWPFFRNGSQVIYSTSTPCTVCGGNHMSGNWDIGLPQGVNLGELPFTIPVTDSVDYTADGLFSVVPLSASQLIYETQSVNHQDDGETTLCFLSPNHRVVSNATNQVRSCESELLVDGNTTMVNQFFPVNPWRAQINIGKSTATGTYGEVWLGGATTVGKTAMMYTDLAYRGYVEPERQLVPQLLP